MFDIIKKFCNYLCTYNDFEHDYEEKLLQKCCDEQIELGNTDYEPLPPFLVLK
jgi:hypothetical protein